MAGKQQLVDVEGRGLTISNLEKILFPGNGFTKGDVIGFYSAIAPVILPHLRDRPLTLKRYPDGVNGDHFYEKNAPKYTPPWVKTFPVPRTEGGPDINYVLCNDRATLVWATNLADIEKHVLLGRAPELGIPTSIVFDLDPGEPAGLLECGTIALHLKGLFQRWGLDDVTQPFAKSVAELVAREMPKLVVSEMAKSIRTGKVFIDWSQNSDFKTTVCVYALRAKAERPFVSMPITWNELARAVKQKNMRPLIFTPESAVKRIAKVGDQFGPVLKLKQELPASFTKAISAGPPPKLSRWPRNRKHSAAGAKDKSLREYAAKRDPSGTPEPPARVAKKTARNKNIPHRYVIQKHAASHLHYDFRLEMQGVLRSWAVPKGPPLALKEARLAMQVEDHPLEYEKFEGTIPPGNYGAGTVMVWDYGLYEDITGNAAAAFHAGKLHIVLKGKKLEGEWILVKDQREPESNKWLLMKAGKSIKPISPTADDRSAISRRTMAAIAKANDAQWQSNRPAAANAARRPVAEIPSPPKFVAPMRCKAVTALPAEHGWAFEIKFDGYRCIAVKNDSGAKLFSRNQKLLNKRFPKVVEAISGLPGLLTLDGEIVALDEHDRPSFQLLQNNTSRALDVYYYTFDLLNRDGKDLRRLPLERRRDSLNDILAHATDPLRLSPLLEGSASQVLEAVRKLGLEGVVGKRDESIYESGERSGAWIKHRTDRAQEFVIGGYIPGGRAFDSLLVGVYENKKIRFVAKVKNGFVPRLRDEIAARFDRLHTATCPFVNLPEKKGARRGDALTAEKMKECRWLKPRLVCEVAFVEWTDAGNLRHATFVAMRDDKRPLEVVRET
jgi:bifunctional non-homologous end joining protein LigD